MRTDESSADLATGCALYGQFRRAIEVALEIDDRVLRESILGDVANMAEKAGDGAAGKQALFFVEGEEGW